ncbi:hypothetical protein ACXO6I_10060, partial [Lactobacillus delbrueckii subsp. bulgaricus]
MLLFAMFILALLTY